MVVKLGRVSHEATQHSDVAMTIPRPDEIRAKGLCTCFQQAAPGAVRHALSKTGAIRGNKTALLVIKEAAATDHQPGHAGPGGCLVLWKIARTQLRGIHAELTRSTVDQPPSTYVCRRHSSLHWRTGVEIGTSQRRNTEVRLTHRWREMDSNLYGAFPVKWCFWFVVGSLFGGVSR